MLYETRRVVLAAIGALELAHGQTSPTTRYNHVTRAIRYLATVPYGAERGRIAAESCTHLEADSSDASIIATQNLLLTILIGESRPTGQQCVKSLPRTSNVYEVDQQVWFNDTPHRVVVEAPGYYVLRPLFPFDAEPDIALPRVGGASSHE